MIRMLKTRVITALALLGVFLPVLFLFKIEALYFTLSIVIGLASWEWVKLLWPQSKAFFYILYAISITIVLYLIWWLGASNLNPDCFYWVQIISLFTAFIFWIAFVPGMMRRGLNVQLSSVRLFLTLAGLILFVACWFALAILRELGLGIFLSVLVWVWAADVGAYFAGKAFGKNKLAPNLSPGKSIEGMIGGILLVLVVGLVLATNGDIYPTFFSFVYERVGLLSLVLILTAGGLLSVIGDLFESQLKRLANVKDSSNLLPGHGGFLDRIDALLPVLPFAALIAIVFI